MDDSGCFYLDEKNDALTVTTKPREKKNFSLPDLFLPTKTHSKPSEADEIIVSQSYYENFEAFIEKFCEEIIQLKLQQKVTDKVFSSCQSLIQNVAEFFGDSLKSCKDYKPALDEILVREQTFICRKLERFGSAYKRQKIFENNQFYVNPIEKTIGLSWKCKVKTTSSIPNHTLQQNTFHYVSIVEKLQSLFSRPAFREMFFKYNTAQKHNCKKDLYIDYCCGENARKCQLFSESNDPVIMIDIAADAVEPCAALKTKVNVHKLMCIYFRIRNIAPEYSSRLNNYHLVALCNNEHIKQENFSFRDLVKPILEDIRHLQRTGVDLGDGKKLRGTLIHVCGDNLGLNEAFGFIRCFSSGHFCRICCSSKAEIENQTFEINEMMQDKESYLALVEKASTGDYKASKGITNYCDFNDLDFFHIFDIIRLI